MKIELHIPTEQYGFVSVSYEGEPEGSYAKEVYDEFRNAFQPKPYNSLPTKDFNAAIDEYLNTGTVRGGTELYYKMSPQQQQVFQELKKSFKRINKQ